MKLLGKAAKYFRRPARYLPILSAAIVLVGATLSLAVRAETPALPTPAGKLTTQDYFEILQLYSRYSQALDTNDGNARAAVFTPDGHFISDITKHVPESMDSMAARTNGGTRKDRPIGGHMMFNILITPTPEGAKGLCEAFIGGGANSAGVIRGTPAFYSDTLVRTTYGWRFKTREVWTATDPLSPFQPPAQP